MKLEIGKCIKSLRLQKGITQEELANYLGVSYQAVSKWETDANTPDIALLPQLSIFFGGTIDDFFKLSDEEHFKRIDNMLLNERIISDEGFAYAKKFLNELLMQDSQNIEALCLLSKLYNHRAKSDHELAKTYAKEALLYEPTNRSLHVRLIEASQGITGDGYIDNHSELIKFYQNFIIQNPTYITGYIILINQLIADSRFKEAERVIKQARKVEDRYVFYIFEGDIQLGLGHREEAVETWNETVERFSHIWQVYACRADRFLKLDRVEEAMKDYHHCFDMQEKPRLVDGLCSLAPLYEERGEYEKAIKIWEQYMMVLQEDHGITTGEALDAPMREIERLNNLKSSSI